MTDVELMKELLALLWIIARDGFRQATEEYQNAPYLSQQSYRAQGQKDAFRIFYTTMLGGDYRKISDVYIEEEERILIDSRTGKPSKKA